MKKYSYAIIFFLFFYVDAVAPPFDTITKNFLTSAFQHNPGWATQSGCHDFDAALESYSAQAIEKKVAVYNSYLSELDAIDRNSLSPEDAVDYWLIKMAIKSTLCDLLDIKTWRQSPVLYLNTLSWAINNLMICSLKEEELLKKIIARERAIPSFLQQAQKNLTHMSRLYIGLALEQIENTITFFTSLSHRFSGREFKRVNRQAITALERFKHFLEKKLKAVDVPYNKLDRATFKKRLWYEEMIFEEPESILQSAYEQLRRLKKEREETALAIDANKTEREIYIQIQDAYPPSHLLMPYIEAIMVRLRDFCSKKNIVTIPPGDMHVKPTPLFLMSQGAASMGSTGVLEKKPEAFFYVTMPTTHEEKQEFNTIGTITLTAHETFPGHGAQFLWQLQNKSIIKKLFGCNSASEGWALYVERLIVEEGFLDYDPQLRFIMVCDAILRCCRLILSIEMHLKDRTLGQAHSFLKEQAMICDEYAAFEVKWMAVDPIFAMSYALGYREIETLKKQVMGKKGKNFSLQQFHDTLLSAGYPPIALIRKYYFNL